MHTIESVCQMSLTLLMSLPIHFLETVVGNSLLGYSGVLVKVCSRQIGQAVQHLCFSTTEN